MVWESFIECHGLTHLDVWDAPEFPAIAPEFLARLIRTDLVIAHNAAFDIGHLRDALDHFCLPKPKFDYLCTCNLARRVWPELPNHHGSATQVARSLTDAVVTENRLFDLPRHETLGRK